MYYLTQYVSPVGRLTIAGDGANIVGLWIAGQKYFLATLPENPALRDDLPIFGRVRTWLDRYFAGEKPTADELPLAPIGSGFRQRVWERLRAIPYGQTVTYGSLAKELGTGSARAVGGAVAHNPISILIPCHRVVGADGSLAGYAGGLEVKCQLLELEGVSRSKFHLPARRKKP